MTLMALAGDGLLLGLLAMTYGLRERMRRQEGALARLESVVRDLHSFQVVDDAWPPHL